jgi:5'-deoxynucleotidase
MSKKLSLYDFLRMGHVKRWHNVNVTREQTLAEHSAMVAIIALQLFESLDLSVKTHEAQLRVVVGALFHDAPEIVTGDFPTPGKKYIREFSKDSEIFDRIDNDLMPVIPYVGGILEGGLAAIVEVADAIEAVHWISENGAGVHAEIVRQANRRKLETLVHEYDMYEPVNEILMAMNMPYIHRDSRISPP